MVLPSAELGEIFLSFLDIDTGPNEVVKDGDELDGELDDELDDELDLELEPLDGLDLRVPPLELRDDFCPMT